MIFLSTKLLMNIFILVIVLNPVVVDCFSSKMFNISNLQEDNNFYKSCIIKNTTEQFPFQDYNCISSCGSIPFIKLLKIDLNIIV